MIQKNVLKIVLIVWVIIGLLYCNHTPYDHRTHDIWGHVPYTKIIVNEHRLPKPYEGWETFQPPLYYLINSFIASKYLKTNEAIHVNWVRAFSILYGAISLLIIGWLVRQVIYDPIAQLLSLLFIATTPAFVFVFSTYNNDSLFTMLAIAVVALSYKLSIQWSRKLAIALLLASTYAFHTKLLAMFLVVTLSVCCCKNLLDKKLPNKIQFKIIGILFASFILLLPWAFFHNYKYTGNLFPTNADSRMDKSFDYKQIKNLIGIVFRIPDFQRQDIGFMTKIDYTHEWDDPWQHPNWEFLHPATKRFDYWGNVFVSSLIGEYIIEKPHVIFIWFIYLIHLLMYIVGLIETPRSSITKLSAFIILLTHFLQILTIPKFPDLPHGAMEYRYICWTWIGWAVLYASALSNHKYSLLLKGAVTIGIAIQVYILVTITGTSV